MNLLQKLYKGRRNPICVLVSTGCDPFDNELVFKALEHRVCHSLTGFEWGCNGSAGPADLAKSILWDLLGAEPQPTLYQSFKERFVANWSDSWQIDTAIIEKWLQKNFPEVLDV